MKFIGIKCEDGLYIDSGEGKYKILHSQTDDGAEIVIKYDSSQPFHIQEICVYLIYSTLFQSKMYSVWQYDQYAHDDIECISISKYFAEEMSKYLKEVLQYFIKTEGLLSKNPIL